MPRPKFHSYRTMQTKYVSRSEAKAHEAAMQRVVEDEKREQESINDKKKATIKESIKIMSKSIKAADEEMRKAIEAAKKANEQAILAAKKRADDETRAVEEAEKGREHAQVNRESQLAAMQKDFERLPLLRQVYHEAPDDVFELIVSKCTDCWGSGGLNPFRLANKRCKQVAESCTTKLTYRQEVDGPESLPMPVIQKCGRIEEIGCLSHNLRSSEGCPDGLKELWIGNSPHISDLSPLASCSMLETLEIDDSPHLSDIFPLVSCLRMKSLVITDSSISDISVVSLMPLLEGFTCQKDPGRPSIKDLSPLSTCPVLIRLYLYGNRDLKDLHPLSACTALERLEISDCPLITSLAPLSSLKKLDKLLCQGIDPQAPLYHALVSGSCIVIRM